MLVRRALLAIVLLCHRRAGTRGRAGLRSRRARRSTTCRSRWSCAATPTAASRSPASRSRPATRWSRATASRSSAPTGFGINSGVFFKFDAPIDPASLPAEPGGERAAGRERLPDQHRPALAAARDAHAAVDRVPRGRRRVARRQPARDHAGAGAAARARHALRGGDHRRRARCGPAAASAPSPFLLQMRADGAATRVRGRRRCRSTRSSGASSSATRACRATRSSARPCSAPVTRPHRSRRSSASCAPRRGREATNLTLDAARSTGHYWVFTGQMLRAAVPERSAALLRGRHRARSSSTPRDARSIQRVDTLSFVLTVPKERDDGTFSMPKARLADRAVHARHRRQPQQLRQRRHRGTPRDAGHRVARHRPAAARPASRRDRGRQQLLQPAQSRRAARQPAAGRVRLAGGAQAGAALDGPSRPAERRTRRRLPRSPRGRSASTRSA